jgi:hypothetical protein
MIAHPYFTLLTAILLAAGLALVEDRTPRQRLVAAARMLGWCLVSVAGGVWLMRLIHG